MYEVVTGKRLFQGEDLTETLASVVKDRPDLSSVPVQVRRLLGFSAEQKLKNISVEGGHAVRRALSPRRKLGRRW